MKKLAAIALVILLLAGLAACQLRSTPTPASPTTTPTRTALPPQPTPLPSVTPTPGLNARNGPPLRSLEMFGGGNGWGLIYNALLLTHDGGVSWFSVPLPGGQVDERTQAFFVDGNTLYLVLPAADGSTGQLYYTGNGGGTWRATPVPFLHGQLAFVDGTGYFLETTLTGPGKMSSTLFASNDKGLTWNRVFPGADQASNKSLPDDGIKTGFGFISPERGWVGVADQQQKIVVYKTENSGKSWAAQDIPVPQNISALQTSSLPPYFFSGNKSDGLLPVDFISIATNDRNRVFYFTRDGGANWAPGESIVDGNTYTFLDPQTGWVWGRRGLYFTSDGAGTWQLLPVAFGRSEQATSIRFVDKKTGWLLTSDAKNRVRIYNTHDGGNTWIAINL